MAWRSPCFCRFLRRNLERSTNTFTVCLLRCTWPIHQNNSKYACQRCSHIKRNMNPKLKSQAVALANKVHIATGSGAFPEEKKTMCGERRPMSSGSSRLWLAKFRRRSKAWWIPDQKQHGNQNFLFLKPLGNHPKGNENPSCRFSKKWNPITYPIHQGRPNSYFLLPSPETPSGRTTGATDQGVRGGACGTGKSPIYFDTLW